ncbi:hypothetical protein MY3296_006669 [Beauveria thailandica]
MEYHWPKSRLDPLLPLQDSVSPRGYLLITRKKIVQHIQEITGLIQNQAQLAKYSSPAGEPAIPYITAPSRDGVRCRTCQYITRDIRRIQRHYREQHGWVNDWKKGGNIKAKQQQPRSLPWTSGVWQRLFRSRAASSWFEVQAVGEVQISIIPNGSIVYPGGEEEHDNTAAILAELDEWDDVSVWSRRLEALWQVDVSMVLACIMGKAATFRPGQATVTAAIVTYFL